MYGAVSSMCAAQGAKGKAVKVLVEELPRPKSSGDPVPTPGPSCGTPALEKVWPPKSGPP